MAQIHHPDQALFDFISSLPPIKASGTERKPARTKRSKRNSPPIPSTDNLSSATNQAAAERRSAEGNIVYRPSLLIVGPALLLALLFYVQLGASRLLVSISPPWFEFLIRDKATVIAILAAGVIVSCFLLFLATMNCLLRFLGLPCIPLLRPHQMWSFRNRRRGLIIQAIFSLFIAYCAATQALNLASTYGGSIGELAMRVASYAKQGRDVEEWQRRQGSDVDYWNKGTETLRLRVKRAD